MVSEKFSMLLCHSVSVTLYITNDTHFDLQHTKTHILVGLLELFSLEQYYFNSDDYTLANFLSRCAVDCGIVSLCIPWIEVSVIQHTVQVSLATQSVC